MNTIQTNVAPRYNQVKQDIKDNSGKVALSGAAGTAAFSTMRKSTAIANDITRVIQKSTKLTKSKQDKLIKIFSKVKWLNNPVMRKITGPLAGFSALSTVVGSATKIADTCNYLGKNRQQ